MSEIQRLIVKEGDQEYELYVESKTAPEVPEQEEPGYRDLLPTINIQEFHAKLRGYTKLALGAFKYLPEAEEVTVKFGIKLGGKVGILRSCTNPWRIEFARQSPRSGKPSFALAWLYKLSPFGFADPAGGFPSFSQGETLTLLRRRSQRLREQGCLTAYADLRKIKGLKPAYCFAEAVRVREASRREASPLGRRLGGFCLCSRTCVARCKMSAFPFWLKVLLKAILKLR